MTYHPRTAPDESGLITSRENPWLKRFRAALRGTGPAESEAIGVEGPKLVEDALRACLEAEALLVSESAEPALDTILRAASASEAGIPRSRILRTFIITFTIPIHRAWTTTRRGMPPTQRPPAKWTDFTSSMAAPGRTIMPAIRRPSWPCCRGSRPKPAPRSGVP